MHGLFGPREQHSHEFYDPHNNQMNMATQATIEQFQNPNTLAEGVIVFKRLDRNLKGSKAVKVSDKEGVIVFSLSDLPLRVVFVNDKNVSIERRTETEVIIGGKHKLEAVETPEEILNKPPPSKLSSAVQNVRDFFVKSEAAEAISDVIHPDAKKKEQVAKLREKYATVEEPKKKGMLSSLRKGNTREI
ncbi:hypothetical protein PROFUN_07086 [Planoprotostelium fungivorum]|uniref:Uncharacterized protein n=1 Tax=Planoprotostelium fungivorum TaxID=1890364 RepID=A0A2P6NNA1_9EUKA|nr:hypothetical protein PROFUN_07086 [Planoprotostelium fungivorum]